MEVYYHRSGASLLSPKVSTSGKRFLDSSMLDEVSNSAVNTETSGKTSIRNDAFNCFEKNNERICE